MKKFLKITMPILLVALVLLSSCDLFSMFAQKGKVTGIVYSSATGEPLEGVRVTASGSSASATTNSDGEFTIELLQEPNAAFCQIGLSVRGCYSGCCRGRRD